MVFSRLVKLVKQSQKSSWHAGGCQINLPDDVHELFQSTCQLSGHSFCMYNDQFPPSPPCQSDGTIGIMLPLSRPSSTHRLVAFAARVIIFIIIIMDGGSRTGTGSTRLPVVGSITSSCGSLSRCPKHEFIAVRSSCQPRQVTRNGYRKRNRQLQDRVHHLYESYMDCREGQLSKSLLDM